MAEPPRLSPIRLPWEKSIIYFVTLCVNDRRKVLAHSKVFEAIKTTIAQLQRWHVLAAVIMPDHGLIQRTGDWPYYLDFVNIKEGSWQLPLQQRIQPTGVGGS